MGPADWLLEYDEDNWYRHRYQFEIAPDRYHKEDISGGPPYTLQAPDAAADGVVVYHASEPQFVELLRQSLAFGGFPGWASDVATDRPSEELGRLTRGLPRV